MPLHRGDGDWIAAFDHLLPDTFYFKMDIAAAGKIRLILARRFGLMYCRHLPAMLAALNEETERTAGNFLRRIQKGSGQPMFALIGQS